MGLGFSLFENVRPEPTSVRASITSVVLGDRGDGANQVVVATDQEQRQENYYLF